jgi:hypothetical protein
MTMIGYGHYRYTIKSSPAECRPGSPASKKSQSQSVFTDLSAGRSSHIACPQFLVFPGSQESRGKNLYIYRSDPCGYILAVEQSPKRSTWRNGHYRRNPDGTTSWVSGHPLTTRGRGKTRSSPTRPAPAPIPPSHTFPTPPPLRPAPPVSGRVRPRHRKKKRKLALAITATVAITVGAVTFTLTRGGSAGASDSVSAQANVDFNQAVAELPKLGYAGKVSQNGASDSSQDCSQHSTGAVRQFLSTNQCKEYAVTLINLHKQGIVTQAVISWVVMATPGLTLQYKNLVDERHQGNPPGQPPKFNGLCYASGQDEGAAWVAQVQPTGQVAEDRQILQAVAPVELSANYLGVHCIG